MTASRESYAGGTAPGGGAMRDGVALPSTRILHIVDALTVGGVQSGLVQCVERTQTQLRHAVGCVRELGTVADDLRRVGVPVHLLGKREGNDWTLIFRIARLCRVLRPQVVHTRNWSAIDGILGARIARVPVVIHSEHGFDLANMTGRRRRKIVRRLLTPAIDHVVTVSEQLRNWLVAEVGVRPDKITVVHNGVDTIRFAPAADRIRLRTSRGYDPREFLVGTVGRLDATKNHSDLLTAFGSLTGGGRPARLLLIGEGAERPALERQIEAAGLGAKVQLVGYRADVAEWLRIMDVFVLPSFMEGTSNALLEAMAVGLPVIATRVGGNPEVVVDGVTGRLVPTHDAAALAIAIESYCRNERIREQHGAAGRARAVQAFSLDNMVAGYTAVYRRAVLGSAYA